jgi:hypothetical protein
LICRAFENNINGKCKAIEAGSDDIEIRNSFMDVKMKKCCWCCYEQNLEWDRERETESGGCRRAEVRGIV